MEGKTYGRIQLHFKSWHPRLERKKKSSFWVKKILVGVRKWRLFEFKWFLSSPSACRTSGAYKNRELCCCFVIRVFGFGSFCMFLFLCVTLCIPMVCIWFFDEFFRRIFSTNFFYKLYSTNFFDEFKFFRNYFLTTIF